MFGQSQARLVSIFSLNSLQVRVFTKMLNCSFLNFLTNGNEDFLFKVGKIGYLLIFKY